MVTLLEVLEHIPEVDKAVAAAVQMARKYVVVTVPPAVLDKMLSILEPPAVLDKVLSILVLPAVLDKMLSMLVPPMNW